MSLVTDVCRLFPLEKTTRSDEGSYRTEYARDYARVLHSPSFRRLQGKTQLFPTQESDFFRNRLTHSLEVSQIAKSIAIKLKTENPTLDIEPDVCAIAGLVHDIGHPPFGHNGEAALDACMRSFGGFEGNAQTLHIITRLEKKECPKDEKLLVNGVDQRVGLNLTARSIASALKYDDCIKLIRKPTDTLKKGYYESEKAYVDKVKSWLLNPIPEKMGRFKTIECSIMDIADDIAYSTYDLEDAFKAGFLTPLDLLSADKEISEGISNKLSRDGIRLNVDDCREILLFIFKDMLKKYLDKQQAASGASDFNVKTVNNLMELYIYSKRMAADGYCRTLFTSSMVNSFIDGVKIDINSKYPILSRVYLDKDTLSRVNVLKHFAYVSLIDSSRLKVAESRGYEIIEKMFNKLCSEGGQALLPEDCKHLYRLSDDEAWRKRVICDFIAGMTDRYAIEFYGRLFSVNPQTIFKPL